ncbi:MAG: choice-of-anchor L domain-containing protein [Myxococcota bacterium]|nr:choice-of-anchor L domain-containing protein [Myxococcota bacterium]
MNRTKNITSLVFFPFLLLACESSTLRPSGTAKDDSDTVSDSTTPTAPEEILPDCSNCPSIGTQLEHLRCAVDLCDDDVFIEQEYASPTCKNENRPAISRAAVARFGSASNDLEPLMNGSYALMATGKAVPKSPVDPDDHNVTLCSNGSLLELPSVPDPYAPEEYPSYDVVEWTLHLRAPLEAHGIKIHYIFFSEEYDEYVGRDFNDKFYMLLNGPITTGGKDQVINFTKCRPTVAKPDFTCPAGQLGCTEGEGYCYVAINSALSECCWYDGCTTAALNTDITGTGFSCGTEATDYLGDYSVGYTKGSSTGWLVTTWPVEPGEELTLTFHLHDTADAILDSEVILDRLVFVKEAEAGTRPVK